jgi:hypothetical protein
MIASTTHHNQPRPAAHDPTRALQKRQADDHLHACGASPTGARRYLALGFVAVWITHPAIVDRWFTTDVYVEVLISQQTRRP